MAKLRSGRATVESTTGNRPLSETPLRVTRVDIIAFPTNTDTVWIGDSKVSATAALRVGMPLDAKEIYTLDDVDLSEVWLAVEVANEGVTWNELA